MTAMRMHLLSGGRFRVRKSIYFPTAERSETVDLPVPCVLIRHPQGNVLFDTGCHPSVVVDAAARWGDLARVMTPIMPEGENVLTALAGLDLTPDDIDVVVCSHLHPDHCGCNAFFTRATVVMHAREIEAARKPGAQAQGYLPVEWDHPMPIDAITGERDLFQDGRIVLLVLPGHTPGTLGAIVATRAQRQLSAGVGYGEPARDARRRHRAAQHLECGCARQIARRDRAHCGARRHRPLRA